MESFILGTLFLAVVFCSIALAAQLVLLFEKYLGYVADTVAEAMKAFGDESASLMQRFRRPR